ncbi:hypothetical protein VUR80DRAFT_3018 [Thermomyces stellatus]
MVSSSRLLAAAVIAAVAVVDYTTDTLSLLKGIKTRVYAQAFWDTPAFGLGRQPREDGRYQWEGNRFNPQAIPQHPQPAPGPVVFDAKTVTSTVEPTPIREWFFFFIGSAMDDGTDQDVAVDEDAGTCPAETKPGFANVCHDEEL